MKPKRTALTLVEMLTVLAVVMLLTGILIPTATAVRTFAKEAKQRGQFVAIDLGLIAFKNDYGDYPPSYSYKSRRLVHGYCGAQKLTEALLGWDLLGFHPKSGFTSNGINKKGIFVYDETNPVLFNQRKGLYLNFTTANAFRLNDLFRDTSPLAADTFVICDVFGSIKTIQGKAGAPILYYKANVSGKTIKEIYDVYDDDALVLVKQRADGKNHKLANTRFEFFFKYIQNSKITARPWPHNPNSYILISAGRDGIYGNDDDICNFGN